VLIGNYLTVIFQHISQAIIIMKLNLFNTVKNEEQGRGQQSVVWLKRSLPCLNPLHVLSTRFSCSHSLCLAFGSFFYPHSSPPPPFIFPLTNQCDRCLVSLVWGPMAGGHRFASHGGITLSRGWLCQKWKPLDILGTHLH